VISDQSSFLSFLEEEELWVEEWCFSFVEEEDEEWWEWEVDLDLDFEEDEECWSDILD